MKSKTRLKLHEKNVIDHTNTYVCLVLRKAGQQSTECIWWIDLYIFLLILVKIKKKRLKKHCSYAEVMRF